MSPNEQLRHLRQTSGHSAAWCATHVGAVNLRTWQYWENGHRKSYPVHVPEDVMERMERLAAAVTAALA